MTSEADNTLSVDEHGVVGSARIFPESGGEIAGQLSVDADGYVRFTPNNPDHDPEKE